MEKRKKKIEKNTIEKGMRRTDGVSKRTKDHLRDLPLVHTEVKMLLRSVSN